MSLLLLALLASAQEEETTEGFRAWKPREGHKAALKSEDVQYTWVKVSRGDAARPLKIEKARTFAATQEILEVEGRVPLRVRRVFTQASHRTNLKERPYGFQGAAVLYLHDPDGARQLSREDRGLITADEAAALRAAFFDGGLDTPDRRPAGAEDDPLWPRTPLKAGQTADLPAQDAARLLGGTEFRDWIDPKVSFMKVTFEKAETRDGARFAKLRYAGIYFLKRFAEWSLEEPIAAKVSYVVDICVDGSRPDAATALLLEVKGSAPVPLGGGATGTLELELRGDVKLSTRSLTEE